MALQENEKLANIQQPYSLSLGKRIIFFFFYSFYGFFNVYFGQFLQWPNFVKICSEIVL